MNHGEHLVVYAAPAHDPVRRVECSCGWSAVGEPSDDRGHHEVLAELLAEWLAHVDQANTSGA